ncbi:hypothetical protein F5Y16DRAFT_39528 [Xylariaceae sp. FL0255]|nr:hypothetical protein F5Y16DRAFT_39528 [Xylariaceae sp. FL0255]
MIQAPCLHVIIYGGPGMMLMECYGGAIPTALRDPHFLPYPLPDFSHCHLPTNNRSRCPRTTVEGTPMWTLGHYRGKTYRLEPSSKPRTRSSRTLITIYMGDPQLKGLRLSPIKAPKEGINAQDTIQIDGPTQEQSMGVSQPFESEFLNSTSTFTDDTQSPSRHSNSDVSKPETEYLRNFVCCDLKLDTMHDLLHHYETAHNPLSQSGIVI